MICHIERRRGLLYTHTSGKAGGTGRESGRRGQGGWLAGGGRAGGVGEG